MKSNLISRAYLYTLAIIIGICLVLYFLYEIRSLILFIFVAGVISLIGRPAVFFLKRRLKMGNTLAAFFTLLLTIAVVGGVLWIFVPIVLEQGKNIAEIDFDLVKTDLNELNEQASEYLGVEQINIVEAIKRTEFVRNFNTDVVKSFVEAFFSNIGQLIAGIFSILFISFFFLRDDKLISNAVTIFATHGKEDRIIKVLEKARELLSRYFQGLLVQTLIVAVLYFFLLWHIDIENPLAIALICAALNIVPYLGPLIGGAVMLLVVVSNNLGADFSSELLPLLVKVLIGVSVVQLIDNLLSQPIIFSQSVRSHPLEIFMIIIIGGLLFSIAGMILAVPVYTTIKVISKEFLSEYKIVKRLTKNL